MRDEYATWMPEMATNDQDGMPDTLIAPLVESLRGAGYTTFQSCQGHPGEGDGTLWIKEAPDWQLNGDPFTRVQHVHHGPEGDYWEFWWEPDNLVRAIWYLAKAYGVGTAEMWHEV